MTMTLRSRQLSWLADKLSGSSLTEVTEKILVDFYGGVEEFSGDLERLEDVDFQHILLLSRETPTHYKWHICTAPDKSFSIWLHEYKPRATRSGGYAQTIHNHRYPMSALLLAGGYRYTQFTVHVGKDQRASVKTVSSQLVSGGSIYSMQDRDFHSVTEMQDGTVSLIIQGRPLRPFSISVDAESRRVFYHVPIEGRIENLRSTLTVTGRRSYRVQK
jgi:hypothetical protein